MDSISNNYKSQIQALQKQLEDEQTAAKAQIQALQDQHTLQLEQERSTVKSLQQSLHSQQLSMEAQIQDVKDEHTSQIDEMISQLDLVVAEYEQKLQEYQSVITQKEAIITALGQQISHTTTKVQEMDVQKSQLEDHIAALQQEIAHQKNLLEESQNETEIVKNTMRQQKENEVRVRKQAVDKVTHELRLAAESQFAEANQYYLKLKSEYDARVEETTTLKKKMQELQSQNDALSKDAKGREMTHSATIAQLKSQIASSDAQMAKLNQRYSGDCDRWREEKQVLEESLQRVKIDCNSAHLSLATLVAEKERLERENKELSGVCEELMAMVEGREVGR